VNTASRHNVMTESALELDHGLQQPRGAFDDIGAVGCRLTMPPNRHRCNASYAARPRKTP
jgi:hypothetical protein